MDESDGGAVVPDLVGLPVHEARDLGHQAAVVVVATDMDGPALGAQQFINRLELHHQFIPQRAWMVPASIKNGKWNLRKLYAIEHAKRDKYRFQFLPRWLKDDIRSGAR